MVAAFCAASAAERKLCVCSTQRRRRERERVCVVRNMGKKGRRNQQHLDDSEFDVGAEEEAVTGSSGGGGGGGGGKKGKKGKKGRGFDIDDDEFMPAPEPETGGVKEDEVKQHDSGDALSSLGAGGGKKKGKKKGKKDKRRGGDDHDDDGDDEDTIAAFASLRRQQEAHDDDDEEEDQEEDDRAGIASAFGLLGVGDDEDEDEGEEDSDAGPSAHTTRSAFNLLNENDADGSDAHDDDDDDDDNSSDGGREGGSRGGFAAFAALSIDDDEGEDEDGSERNAEDDNGLEASAAASTPDAEVMDLDLQSMKKKKKKKSKSSLILEAVPAADENDDDDDDERGGDTTKNVDIAAADGAADDDITMDVLDLSAASKKKKKKKKDGGPVLDKVDDTDAGVVPAGEVGVDDDAIVPDLGLFSGKKKKSKAKVVHDSADADTTNGGDVDLDASLELDLKPRKKKKDKTAVTVNDVGLVQENADAAVPLRVGVVLSVARHPKADKLHVCSVSIDNDAPPTQIVCGASSIAANQLVVVALVGAVVPQGSLAITETKIRGVESSGMLLGVHELGYADADDNEGKDLLFVVPDTYSVGDVFDHEEHAPKKKKKKKTSKKSLKDKDKKKKVCRYAALYTHKWNLCPSFRTSHTTKWREGMYVYICVCLCVWFMHYAYQLYCTSGRLTR